MILVMVENPMIGKAKKINTHDIISDNDNEIIYKYKNKLTGEILYGSSLCSGKNIDGVDFVPVFPKPIDNKTRRMGLMRLENLERLYR